MVGIARPRAYSMALARPIDGRSMNRKHELLIPRWSRFWSIIKLNMADSSSARCSLTVSATFTFFISISVASSLIVCRTHTINRLECTGNCRATSNNIKLVHWPLMRRLLHLVQRWGYWARLLFAVPNVTAHPSTASVPITVLLYNGP